MWKLIYRAIHILFGIALVLGLAVVLSVLAGGPLLLWLVIVVVGGVGLYLAWPRLQQVWPARPLDALKLAVSSATLLPALATTQTDTRSDITTTLPRPSTRTAVSAATSAVWPSEWSGALEASEQAAVKNNRALFWAFTREQALYFLALGLTALVAIGLRVYQLNTLQTELYGDINLIHDYVNWILNGDFPLRFLLSTGPLYHYLLMPFVGLFGANYDTYKGFSVLISLAGIAATYLASRRLLFALQPAPPTHATQHQSDWFAVLTAFIMSVSSWYLVFSRLGNSQILVPLLVVLALWLLLRFVQDNDLTSLIWCAIASALGLYVYPQSFVLPVAIAVLLILFKIAPRSEIQGLAPRRVHTPITWGNVLLFCGVVTLCAVPFPFIVANSTAAINTYITPKLGAQHPLGILVTNIVNTVLAFHITGDETFRSNPPNLPHLDLVSGIFMVVGFIYWFRRNRVAWLALLILFIILQLPSVLVLIEPVETPSASRTLGAAPIAYVWAASGIWWLITWLRSGQQPATSDQPLAARSGLLAAGIAVVAILGLNLYRYFDSYIKGLPYNNVPIVRLVTDYVNLLPPTTQVYMAGCCWERGMPEPKGITYEMRHPTNWHFIARPETLTCDKIKQYPAGSVLIWSYKQPVPSKSLLVCQDLMKPQTYTGKNGFPAFHAATLWSGPVMAASPPAPTASDVIDTDADSAAIVTEAATANANLAASTSSTLSSVQVQLNGQPVQVLHSAFDMGGPAEIFDQNVQTLARGEADNPFILQLEFAAPRDLRGIAITVGTMTDVEFSATFTKDDGSIETVNLKSSTLPPDPRVELVLPDGTQPVRAVKVDILDRRQPPEEGFHTHIRDVALIP